MSAQDRSASRGRDTFKSTGRGGAGNFIQRAASQSRDARPESGPDDFSTTRGREPVASPAGKAYTTGRGGAGNYQYTSQTPKADTSFMETEREVTREHVSAQDNPSFSSGRGGLGNFAANRSRSREPALTTAYSSGRGGAGNIHIGDGTSISVIDEEERKQHASHNADGYRSTGRGGSANFATGQEPPVERQSFSTNKYESTGRGGAGNIIREGRARSSSRRDE